MLFDAHARPTLISWLKATGFQLQLPRRHHKTFGGTPFVTTRRDFQQASNSYARLSNAARSPFRRSLPHARAQANGARSGRALLPLRGAQPHDSPTLGPRLRASVGRVQERAAE